MDGGPFGFVPADRTGFIFPLICSANDPCVQHLKTLDTWACQASYSQLSHAQFYPIGELIQRPNAHAPSDVVTGLCQQLKLQTLAPVSRTLIPWKQETEKGPGRSTSQTEQDKLPSHARDIGR